MMQFLQAVTRILGRFCPVSFSLRCARVRVRAPAAASCLVLNRLNDHTTSCRQGGRVRRVAAGAGAGFRRQAGSGGRRRWTDSQSRPKSCPACLAAAALNAAGVAGGVLWFSRGWGESVCSAEGASWDHLILTRNMPAVPPRQCLVRFRQRCQNQRVGWALTMAVLISAMCAGASSKGAAGPVQGSVAEYLGAPL
jgi:hypothetical protein